MTTSIAFATGSLLLLTAFSVNVRTTPASRPEFHAEIVGDIAARPTGAARFGVSGGTENVPAVFTISLGAGADDASVLFTRQSGAALSPGTYTISNRDDGTDDLRALVMTGPATRPTGVFQGQSGSVVITAASPREIRGTFRVSATGFLAADPEKEDRPVKVTGSFTASR
jgi:hypothetical protein